MSSLPTVLICTYPVHGQANVNLATSYELALSGVNVHIASFALLKNRVDRLQELVDRHASRSSAKPTGSVVFCELKNITSYVEASRKNRLTAGTLLHPCGVLGALQSYRNIGPVSFPWGREEYFAAIDSFKEIVGAIKPDVVAIDPLFLAPQDACKLMNQKFVILSPTGIKEATVNMQPYLAAFWKYPAFVVKSI